MSSRTLLKSVLVSAAVLTGVLFVAPGAWADDEETFKTLCREGKDAYLRGNAKEAYEKFEQAMRIKVDDRLVLYIRDEVGYKVLVQMMMDPAEPQLRQTALRLMEYAKGRADSWRRNHEEREALVMALDSNKFDQVQEAELKLRNCGTFACQELVDHLGDPRSETLRTNIIVCLSHMGSEATMAVAEALNSTDKLTQQNAAVVLGNLHDIRGLGELRRVAENGGTPAEVKTFVDRAIQRIMEEHPEETTLAGKTAKETMVVLAERWYRSHPSVMHYQFGDWMVWRWSAAQNKLVGREVPPFAMNEELAEEACHDAIALDNAYMDAWSLLACVSFQQHEEGQIALEDTEWRFSLNEVKQEDLDKLKAELLNIEQAQFLGQMAGRDALFQALAKSLADDTAQVSVAICWALAKTAQGGDLPAAGDAIGTPLSDALMNKDKRVRYAAAIACVYLNPKQSFTNSDRVIVNLADAAAEQTVRVALLIEPDDNTRGQMRETLNSAGIYVVEAPDAKRGIMKAKEFPNEDVIICDGTTLNQVVFSVEIRGKNQAEASVLDSLQQDLRTKSIPVVVTGSSNEELAKWQGIFKEEVKDYVLKSAAAEEWTKRLEPLFAVDRIINRSKKRAEKAAIDACDALAHVRIQDTIFSNYSAAVPSLIQALDGRPDTVRIPACRALGSLGQAEGCDALSKILSDTGADKNVRMAAAEWGLARIYQQSGAAPSEDQVKALVAGITDADLDVQRSTSKAVGAARMTPEQRANIFAQKRLHQLK
jgi:CheY-like chemotaxis protein